MALRTTFCIALTAACTFACSITTAQVAPTAAEQKAKNAWVEKNLLGNGKAVPFSFRLGDEPSSEFLKSAKRSVTSRKLDDNRTEHELIWRQEKSPLEVRCVVVDYNDYPAVEWTTYVKNIGDGDTPIVEGLQGLDTSFRRKKRGEFKLHGIKGDWCVAESFEPFVHELGPHAAKTLAPFPYSGKSSDGPDGFPYFNLQMPGAGVIVAIGWPGQWQATFQRDGQNNLNIRAGQQQTRFTLHPGEEMRTPLIAMLFWDGKDFVRSQNLWRRWYNAHILPQDGGQPLGPQAQIQVSGNDQEYVQKFLDAGIQPQICWRDAGGGNTWYPSDNGPYQDGAEAKPGNVNTSWLNTGTWDIDARKYPQGFRPFSDWARERGMKFLLWFEPERVGNPDSWLGKNHPEWLLPATDSTVGAILNLGNPAALDWLTNHVDGLIKSQGLGWYREDMNGNGPLPTWRNNDAPDRQGITENLYVQGHLKFWDALKQRNPGLQIDSCASGGRRNDLETMRRAVPLLRSDFQFPDSQQGVIDGNQCHTYGLSFWLPFQGTGVYRYDPYSFRSFYLPSFGMGSLSPETMEAQAKAYEECGQIAPQMLFGDYYPLTPYSLANNVWIGWQFDRPESGDGCVQVFRRAENHDGEITLKLHGLDPKKSYEVRNFDVEETDTVSGKELMTTGLKVSLPPQSSAIFQYTAK